MPFFAHRKTKIIVLISLFSPSRIRFMCAETVEQKIHALQEHKLGIADGVLTGTVNKGSKLTIDDLKSLFGL